MPVNVITKFAPKYAERKDIDIEVAREKLEELWDRAKKIAKEKGLNEDEGGEFWPFVMGVWKKMSGFKSDDDGKSESSTSRWTPITISMSSNEPTMGVGKGIPVQLMRTKGVLASEYFSKIPEGQDFHYVQDDYDDGLQTLIVFEKIGKGVAVAHKEVWRWPSGGEIFEVFDRKQRSDDFPRMDLYNMIKESASLESRVSL